MSESDEAKAAIEARMLSGEPFTFGELSIWAMNRWGKDAYRIVDRSIQRLRKGGKISFERTGNRTVWTPTPSNTGEA